MIPEGEIEGTEIGEEKATSQEETRGGEGKGPEKGITIGETGLEREVVTITTEGTERELLIGTIGETEEGIEV